MLTATVVPLRLKAGKCLSCLPQLQAAPDHTMSQLWSFRFLAKWSWHGNMRDNNYEQIKLRKRWGMTNRYLATIYIAPQFNSNCWEFSAQTFHRLVGRRLCNENIVTNELPPSIHEQALLKKWNQSDIGCCHQQSLYPISNEYFMIKRNSIQISSNNDSGLTV